MSDHKARRAANHVRISNLNRKLIRCYLLANPCVECGEADPELLDFDHVRGTKRKAVTQMVHQRYSWVAIFQEIAKTEVRCCVCHRRRTNRMLRERRSGLKIGRHQ